jgi:hypothetical protein
MRSWGYLESERGNCEQLRDRLTSWFVKAITCNDIRIDSRFLCPQHRGTELHVQEGKVRTPDLGGTSCTGAVGDNLCEILLR